MTGDELRDLAWLRGEHARITRLYHPGIGVEDGLRARVRALEAELDRLRVELEASVAERNAVIHALTIERDRLRGENYQLREACEEMLTIGLTPHTLDTLRKVLRPGR